jgi:integrase
MALTDSSIRSAKPRQKQYKLYDEDGLYLLITPTGGRLWRFKFQFDGVEKGISLGKYPDVSLKLARDRRDDARRKVADGVNPSAVRQAEKTAHANDFRSVAEEWLSKVKKNMEPKTHKRIEDRFKKWVYGHIGRRPITKVVALDLLTALRVPEGMGRLDTAHRTKADCSRVFCYGAATGRGCRDVTVDLKGALAPVKKIKFAGITDPAKLGGLLRAIDGYDGQPTTRMALKLAPYLFLRPTELRAAPWKEVDFDRAEWRIPKERMKADRMHVIPLARQVVALLRELQKFTGGGTLMFPTLKDPLRPMSENTINSALRRMGYTREEQTGHGFRTTASTFLNENEERPDWIELQLAHKEKNQTRGAYNEAQKLAKRREMMQRWADHLDMLRAGGDGNNNNVVPIRAAATT